MSALEPWKSWLGTVFHSPEEGVESPVHSAEDAPADVQMQSPPVRVIVSDDGKLFHLIDATDPDALHTPGIATLLQGGVVEGSTVVQNLLQSEVPMSS